MPVTATINHKGGVTKTSTVVHLGAALRAQGHRVLLVDADPQGHVSEHLGVNRTALTHGLEHVLTGNLDMRRIVIEREGLDIAPSGHALFKARWELAARYNADTVLAKALRPLLPEYDHILIDSPPDESILTINAMFASTHILVPTTLRRASLAGIQRVIANIGALQDAHERDWPLLGIVVNQFHLGQRGQNGIHLDMLEEGFGDLLFKTRIRVDEAFPRCWTLGQHVLDAEPRSKGAHDFRALADEIVARMQQAN